MRSIITALQGLNFPACPSEASCEGGPLPHFIVIFKHTPHILIKLQDRINADKFKVMPDLDSIKYHVLSIKQFIHNTKHRRSPGFTLIELLIACHPKLQRRKVILGFTLIELLVVIAILGVLATAILIAINPAKRTRQARDAQRKSNINAIANAFIGFNTITGTNPDETFCDTSKGTGAVGCVFGTVPVGSDWDKTGAFPNDIYQSLVVKQGFLKSLPIDPVNNSTFFYSYEPSSNGSYPPNDEVCDSGTCNYYWIGAKLEEPQDPTKPIFRCSDWPTLINGPGCKEVQLSDSSPWWFFPQY